MARFCMNCGAPIEGSRFCTRCGTPVDEAGPFSGAVGGASVGAAAQGAVPVPFAEQPTVMQQPVAAQQPMMQQPTMQQSAAYQSRPQPGQAYQPYQGSASQPAAYQVVADRPAAKKGLGKGAKIGLVAAACVLVAGAGVALAVLHPWAPDAPASSADAALATSSDAATSVADDSSSGVQAAASASSELAPTASQPAASGDQAASSADSSATSPAQDASSNLAGSSAASSGVASPIASPLASSASSAADSSASEQASGASADYYEDLHGYYTRAGSYDSRIADAAVTFNNGYTSSSQSDRANKSNAAHELMAEIQREVQKLGEMDVPSDSPYYNSYLDMKILFKDLDKRISVICAAWEKSLEYSSPADHKDDIVAPLSVDNDSTGKNVYKKEFDELYPKAEPKKQ